MSIHVRLYALRYPVRCLGVEQVFGYVVWEPSVSASASGLSYFSSLRISRRYAGSSLPMRCCMRVQPTIHSKSHHLTSLYRQCHMHAWSLPPMASLPPRQISLEWLVWIPRNWSCQWGSCWRQKIVARTRWWIRGRPAIILRIGRACIGAGNHPASCA